MLDKDAFRRVDSRTSKKFLLSSAAIFVMMGMATPALAQAQQAAAPEDPLPAAAPDQGGAGGAAQAPAGQDIVVTGSSIRGIPPVGSQLIGVSSDQIATTAPANTKELLANVPQLGNFGTNAEQSTSNRFRTAGFQPNIHNVGIYATLTLFNGHRFAPVGGEAVFPDPSIIPVIAVQRVEVVADGGSAIYGSDAVAGVVNFIYRKNFEGVEATGTIGFNSTRYRKYDAALLAGHQWGTGGVMLAYEYSQNKSPLNTDIDFLARGGDQTGFGTDKYPGRDLRGTNCLLPNVNIVSPGGDPRGTNYAYQADGSLIAGQNKCGILTPATIIPDSHRHSVLLTAHQEIGEHVDLWTEVNYSNYQTTTFGGQSNLTLRIPSTNPYFSEGLPDGVDPSDVAGGYYIVRRSGLGLFNSRNPASIQYSKVWGVTVGADVDLGGDWRLTPMVHVSKTNDYNSDPELDPVTMEAASNLTTPNALNPFGQAADNDPAILASIDDNYRRDNITSQRLREIQIKADGALFSIPGGEVRAAFGADMRDEQAVQRQTSGSPTRAADIFLVRDDDISRTVFAGFGELNVPFISGQNALSWMQRVTLSLAGRLDYYKEYGTKFNPKIGLVIEPIRGYSLHGSYGTSFVAPNMGLLGHKFGYVGSINSTGAYTYTFPADSPRAGQTIKIGNQPGTEAPVYNVYNSGGGNPDLQPEKANTWSIGVDLAPPQVKGLRLSVSYYNVDYKNTIYKATMQDVMTNPAFAPYVYVNPTIGSNTANPLMDAEMAKETAVSPPEMDVPSYIVWDIIFRSFAINLGERKYAGLDFDGAYDIETGIGHFSLTANANLKLTDKQRVLPGTPWSDRLGTDQAPRWKGRATLNWELDPVTLNLAMNYTDGFKYITGVSVYGGTQNVKPWTTFDLVGRVSLDSVREGLSLQGRIVNLFDKDPPFVDTANGYLPALASPFGRQFEVTVRAKF